MMRSLYQISRQERDFLSFNLVFRDKPVGLLHGPNKIISGPAVIWPSVVLIVQILRERYSRSIYEQAIVQVFFPLKSSKYKKVKVRCIKADLRQRRFT